VSLSRTIPRSHSENRSLRRRRKEKVARRATSGTDANKIISAPKVRTEDTSARLQCATSCHPFKPDVACLATFLMPLRSKRFFKQLLKSTALLFLFSTLAVAQQLPRDEWGATAVTVTHESSKWMMAGKKNKVTLDESTLALRVQTGSAEWAMNQSSAKDMLVKAKGEEFYLRLADAKKISIVPYDTGFKTGVKISLSQWKHQGTDLDLALFLTICLEGKDEELVFDTSANEHDTTLRQLDWPTALDASAVD